MSNPIKLQPKYTDPETGKPINLQEVLKGLKQENKDDLNNMIELLQKQKKQNKFLKAKERYQNQKKKLKENDEKMRSQRNDQFTRHNKIFQARSTENLYFSKPIGLPPTIHEKKPVIKIKKNSRYNSSNNKSSQYKSVTDYDLSPKNSTIYNPYTSKEGSYFDQYGVYKRQSLHYSKSSSNLSLTNTKQNINNNGIGQSTQTSLLQKTLGQENSINNNNKFLGNSLISSANQSMQSNLGFKKSQQRWQQHYGITQQKPFFNSIHADSVIIVKKPIKVNKNISEKQFLPSNSYPKQRLFQEYPHSLPVQEKEIKLDEKFTIQMGF